jgi:D-psicose/D-tagatose/L-ribulose 3-epimerase
MKFSICNEMFEGWKLTDVMDYAKSIGYDGVEIAPFTISDSVVDIDAGERRKIADHASSLGLDVVGLHWLLVKPEGLYINHPDEGVRGKTAEYMMELTRFCGDIGGKVMVIGSPKQRNVVDSITRQKAWELAKEVFGKTLEVAEERGVTLCMEPLAPEETNFINTAEEAMEMAKEMGSANFKIILDVKAMSSEGRDVAGIIRSAKGLVGHVHANDANKRGPGFGETDFVPIARALREIGYDGYVSVEVFDFSPDPKTIATRSLEYLRKAFA